MLTGGAKIKKEWWDTAVFALSTILKGILGFAALIAVQYAFAYGLSRIWWPWIAVPFMIVVVVMFGFLLVGAAQELLPRIWGRLWGTSPKANFGALKTVLVANRGILTVGLVGLGTMYLLQFFYGPLTAGIGGALAGAMVMQTWEESWKEKIVLFPIMGALFAGIVWLLESYSQLPPSIMLAVCIVVVTGGIIAETFLKKEKK